MHLPGGVMLKQSSQLRVYIGKANIEPVHSEEPDSIFPADLSEWQVPKAKYVEAISGDRNWIRPKKRLQ
jgi:hypothetical protein